MKNKEKYGENLQAIVASSPEAAGVLLSASGTMMRTHIQNEIKKIQDKIAPQEAGRSAAAPSHVSPEMRDTTARLEQLHETLMQIQQGHVDLLQNFSTMTRLLTEAAPLITQYLEYVTKKSPPQGSASTVSTFYAAPSAADSDRMTLIQKANALAMKLDEDRRSGKLEYSDSEKMRLSFRDCLDMLLLARCVLTLERHPEASIVDAANDAVIKVQKWFEFIENHQELRSWPLLAPHLKADTLEKITRTLKGRETEAAASSNSFRAGGSASASSSSGGAARGGAGGEPGPSHA